MITSLLEAKDGGVITRIGQSALWRHGSRQLSLKKNARLKTLSAQSSYPHSELRNPCPGWKSFDILQDSHMSTPFQRSCFKLTPRSSARQMDLQDHEHKHK